MSTIKSPVEIIDSAVQSIDSDVRFMKTKLAVLKSGKIRNMLSKLMQPLLYAVGEAGNVYISVNYGRPEINVTMYRLDSMKQRELVWALEYLTMRQTSSAAR
jgi:hypothetical protein